MDLGMIFKWISARALKDLKGKNNVERYARRMYLLLMFFFISINVNVPTLPYSHEKKILLKPHIYRVIQFFAN